MRLFDTRGNRLYLDAEERQAFLAAAREQERQRRTFCETLFFTGCRLSEALEVTPKRVEIKAGQVILRSLKKRRTDVFRAVPVPAEFLDTLDMVHGIKQARRRPKLKDAPLWSWSSVHAWRVVKEVMELAEIPGSRRAGFRGKPMPIVPGRANPYPKPDNKTAALTDQ